MVTSISHPISVTLYVFKMNCYASLPPKAMVKLQASVSVAVNAKLCLNKTACTWQIRNNLCLKSCSNGILICLILDFNIKKGHSTENLNLILVCPETNADQWAHLLALCVVLQKPLLSQFGSAHPNILQPERIYLWLLEKSLSQHMKVLIQISICLSLLSARCVEFEWCLGEVSICC